MNNWLNTIFHNFIRLFLSVLMSVNVVQNEALAGNEDYSDCWYLKDKETEKAASTALAFVSYIRSVANLKQDYIVVAADLKEDSAAAVAFRCYNKEFIDRVSFLINKKMIKKDDESQTIEDVICLVFLEYYFEEFASKHEDKKIISILQKTWGKMSKQGHNFALNLKYSDKSLALIKQALN